MLMPFDLSDHQRKFKTLRTFGGRRGAVLLSHLQNDGIGHACWNVSFRTVVHDEALERNGHRLMPPDTPRGHDRGSGHGWVVGLSQDWIMPCVIPHLERFGKSDGQKARKTHLAQVKRLRARVEVIRLTRPRIEDEWRHLRAGRGCIHVDLDRVADLDDDDSIDAGPRPTVDREDIGRFRVGCSIDRSAAAGSIRDRGQALARTDL